MSLSSPDINNAEFLFSIKKGIARGDENSLELLYRLYFKKLLSFAQTFLNTKEVAEEIVEDIFIKIWAKREDVVLIQNLKVYLYKCVKNAAINELHKQANRIKTEQIDSIDHNYHTVGSTPIDHLIVSEMLQSIEITVAALPQRCRQIFKLIREDGLKYKEVAEILNISVNTIDNQMAIAVKRICAALSIKKNTTSRLS